MRDGKLVLGGGSVCLVTGGRKMVMAQLVSTDLKTWQELPEPFLVADETLHPAGDRLGIRVEEGTLSVSNVTGRPLLAHVPAGARRPPE